jgi:hypothetical protein
MSKEWMDVLRARTAETSQRKVAEELGVSAAMVNQVLKGSYTGNTDTLRTRVEGAYMDQCVACPVLGRLPVHECEENQKRPFTASNPQRVRLYRACRAGCPHSKLSRTATTQRIDVQPVEEGRYLVDQQLDYCERMAAGDNARQVELLRRELRQVAQRLNDLLWQRKFKGN